MSEPESLYVDGVWPPRLKRAKFKGDDEPSVVSRHTRKATKANALKKAYAEVDRRDMSICWITGRTTKAKATDARVRREHHHLKGRNVRPEWVTDPDRIITVCAEAHALITAGFIVVEGTDARKVIRFWWASHVKPKQRILEIQGRRSV